MSEQVPQSIWQGEFTIFGVPIKCHLLDNGERVIEADSIEQLLFTMSNGEPTNDEVRAELEEFARWMRSL